MKGLSHSPIFPAADSELTSTFLQWSHQCVPLRVLTPLIGMKLHWISLWACGRRTSGINRTGKGSVAGTEMAAFTGGGKPTKTPWKPVIPCSLIHICFAGTFLQAPYSPSLLQNEFPRVSFWFFIENRPCLSGTLPSPWSPKGLQGFFSASGPLHSALHNPGFYQGKQISHMKSVSLELSSLVYSF